MPTFSADEIIAAAARTQTRTITKAVRYSQDPALQFIKHGWAIWNAPRPIHGTLLWHGDFLDGVFWSAIDPADAMAGWMTTENLRLNATPVRYASQEMARAWLAEKVATDPYYAENIADWESWFTERDIWSTFVEGNAVTMDYTVPA